MAGMGVSSKSKSIKKGFVVNRGKRLSKNEKDDDSSEDEDEFKNPYGKKQLSDNDDSDSDAHLFTSALLLEF